MRVRPSFLVALLIATGLEAICQTQPQLNVPPDWTVEKFDLPPSFAPQFPLNGTEEAIFSPGWARSKTHDYWTYCYLWSLTGYPSLDKNSLENALQIYYSRLVISNLKIAYIDPGYATPVKVKLVPSKANTTTFTGNVSMLDYMTQEQIILNIRVKQKAGKRLFFELSPLPFTDKIWATMDSIYH